jgi:hypothetical protein
LAAALAVALVATPAALVAQLRCGDAEATPDEGHQHLLGDAPPPVGYRSTPPASGWHYRQRDRIRLGVAAPGAPLTEPEHVSVLAVGGVVISYRDLDAGDVRRLEAVVNAAGERPVALTSYGALEPGEVALTAWGIVQRCDGVDTGAVEAFVLGNAADVADFTMAGEDHSDHEAGASVAADPGAGPGDAAGTALPPWALGASALALLAAFGLAARRALRMTAGR